MNKKEILDLIQDGTITAEEGMRLLEAAEETLPVAKPQRGKGKMKMLKVLIDSNENGKNSKVTVNVPTSLIKLALETGKGMNINGMDLSDKVDIDLILQAIEEDAQGEIVNIQADDATVLVIIE